MADISQPSKVVQFLIDRRKNPGGLKRGISTRAAAARAKDLAGDALSEPTWRRIESGEKVPEDRELVLMAAAINDLAGDPLIAPDDLYERGRPVAAELFKEWIRERTRTDSALASIDADVTPEHVQQRFQAMLQEIRTMKGVPKEQRSQMEAILLAQINTTLETYGAQLRILRPE
ncbi:hypothetical protein [Nonomuraea gerenzanensis]|uniref:hypothetical protein n=1 Tax=Nonomuraea gerenzanensis TaxID=93944 RepID=UPI001CDA4829|nr:hypothetical protein [Nonomuraea gerenzanensis]UBU16625.1 hypothetical protein LCN96_16890 [Nonomuraea gerenzanensis]